MKSSSYYWSSILKARVVLVCGSKWVVGNGVAIKVSNDRWIPRPHSFQMLSSASVRRENMLVRDLIDWDSFAWNMEELHSLFSVEEVGLICTMPISFREPCDHLA